MSSPIIPSQFKALIPSVNGNFCRKFLNFLDFPNLFYDWYTSVYGEDGEFTEDFQAMICALDCSGGGSTTPPGVLAAPLISATDGAYADKIEVTWNSIVGATAYDLYRSSSNNESTAVIIQTDITGSTASDSAVVVNHYYYYWVKAKNQTQSSGFSNADRGHAGQIQVNLAAVTDLVAGQGLGQAPGAWIPLVFTAVGGAESYDFYRNTTDDFTTATLIDAQRTAWNNAETQSFGPSPFFVDNGSDELIYFHDPGNGQTTGTGVQLYHNNYYFWVVARKSGPAASSPPSNGGYGAKGWGSGQGDQVIGYGAPTLEPGFDATVPAGISKAWCCLTGAGAAGGGGDTQFGGGGGGGGATVTGLINVVVGAKFRIVHVPEADAPDTPAHTNGVNGSTSILYYSANGTFSDQVEIARSSGNTGGQYNASGGGAGGLGATGLASGPLTQTKVYNGRPGLPGVGQKGGRRGQRFGQVRLPGAHYNGYGTGTFPGWSGQASAGSGSYAASFNVNYATAGRGTRGKAFVYFKV